VGNMKNKKELYDIIDIKEDDSFLERYRKEVFEKYIEYEISLLEDFKNRGKTIDDYIEHIKTTLWYIKDQRAQRIKKELGL
jgi:hypothetical protein